MHTLAKRTSNNCSNNKKESKRTDLEDHADALGGQLDLGGVDQQGLHDLLGPHVGNSSVAHVDAAGEVALVVSVAEFSHHGNGVDAGVLGQCVRNDLQSLV